MVLVNMASSHDTKKTSLSVYHDFFILLSQVMQIELFSENFLLLSSELNDYLIKVQQ